MPVELLTPNLNLKEEIIKEIRSKFKDNMRTLNNERCFLITESYLNELEKKQ